MDFDDEAELDPEVDMYEALQEILDEGRLPVACFIRPGLVYYRSYDIAEWSPVMTEPPVERQRLLVRIMRVAYNEGCREDPSGDS